MKPEQFEDLQKTILNKIDSTVESSIEKYVNGKIRRLDEKLDNYIKTDIEHRIIEREATKEWRENADNKLNVVSRLQGFSDVALYSLGFIAAIGGAFGAILAVIKLVTGRW